MPVILAVEITGLMCKGGIGTYLRGRGGSRFVIAGFFFGCSKGKILVFAGICPVTSYLRYLYPRNVRYRYRTRCRFLYGPRSGSRSRSGSEPGPRTIIFIYRLWYSRSY